MPRLSAVACADVAAGGQPRHARDLSTVESRLPANKTNKTNFAVSPQAYLIEKVIKQTPDIDGETVLGIGMDGAAPTADAPPPPPAKEAINGGVDEGAIAESVKACIEDGLFITVDEEA